MRITYAGATATGPVRANNEDYLDHWEPPDDDADAWRVRGAVVILADGVGGHGHGEVASKLACTYARQTFLDAKAGSTPAQLVWQMFTAANLAVYHEGMKQGSEGRMLTTLTACVLRHNELTFGHVGDCRALVVQDGRVRRITSDHSYAGVQLKLGLVTVNEAAHSSLRSVLTRAVGQDPLLRIDYHTAAVSGGDYLVQCTDGLWSFVTDREIYEAVTRQTPAGACESLSELALKRGSDDNLTIQIVRVESVERPHYYRGQTVYQKAEPAVMGQELEPGQTLDNRYQITDLISRSGMARIFKAHDTLTNRSVALKIPSMQFEGDPSFLSRFEREARIGRTLRHPYILRFEEPPEHPSRPYIVMEYLEGQTLGHLMRSVRPVPATDALRIAGRVCEALHYMHGHDVVHRDLKPENVMICNDGSIRVMDFGIAKYEGMRRLTFGNFTPTMGTPDYMAPEQVRGKRGDRRTDIYSLGAILYEMVTGALPFEGANPFLIMNARLSGDPVAPRKHNPALSEQVEELILRAMARNPADRYPTALDMKHDLDHPDEVRVTGLAARLQTPTAWRTRRRTAGWAAAAVLLGCAAVWAVVYLAKHLRWE